MERKWAMALSALVLAQACGSAPGVPNVPPTPTATPSPVALPSGRAEATALGNLALVRSLEAGKRPGTVLVTVFAVGVEFDGRADYVWSYVFLDSGPPLQIYQWDVGIEGGISLDGPIPPITSSLSHTDLGPLLQIDSDRAIALAIDHGGRDYVRRHPSAKAGLTARMSFGLPVWQVRFFVPEGGVCVGGPIEIHATTGEFVSRDSSCAG
jgi:hypothetical protein